MPVKNIKRRTNDGLEGTITGLTKEEKEVLNKSGFASSKDVEELTKVMPTDVGVKDNKLGLMHDKTWLTNQNAINLDGFTYDEATKTLKASGGGSGGTIHLYSINISSGNNSVLSYIAASEKDYQIGKDGEYVNNFHVNSTYADLREQYKKYSASGFWYQNNKMLIVYQVRLIVGPNPYQIYVLDNTNNEITIIQNSYEGVGTTIYQIC